MSKEARHIFGQRAAYYATSESHKDKTVLGRLVELARARPDMHVLDVATGTGHTAFALAPHVSKVIAADITPEMLDEGRKMNEELQAANVIFELADVHDLPFGDGTFDIVTCRRAAHHFKDIVRAVQEMRRVLKAGGRLVIDDRSVPADDFVDATMNRLDKLHDRSHVREYRPAEWARMLTEAAFDVEVIEPYTRHRPLSSLTGKAESEDVEKILAAIASLTESERAAMNVVKKDDEIYTNHWYVMAVGIKQEGGNAISSGNR